MLRGAVFVCIFAIAAAAGCTDGINNVLVVDDNTAYEYDIHFKDVVGHTYDGSGKPSCSSNGKYCQVNLPGHISLVAGFIIVTAPHNLATDGNLLVTLRKNSLLIGTVCNKGKSMNVAVPDADCQAPVQGMFGAEFTQMLSTPGTYDLSRMNSTVVFPSIQNALTKLIDGEWYAEVQIVSGGKTVADFKVPSNSNWFVLHM